MWKEIIHEQPGKERVQKWEKVGLSQLLIYKTAPWDYFFLFTYNKNLNDRIINIILYIVNMLHLHNPRINPINLTRYGSLNFPLL